MPRGIKLSVKDLTHKDLSAVDVTDKEIMKRTGYGVRREVAKEPSTRIVWSNAGAHWIVYLNRIEPGTEVELDANEIMVPFSPARMERIADFLVELPLYAASIEAKMRGAETPWTADATWAMGQIERLMREEIEKGKRVWGERK